MRTKTIPFAELRQFLYGLGYKEKHTDNAYVFHRNKTDLLIFRRYADQEPVREGDVVSTRKFLDGWGILEADDFDAFLERTAKPA